MLKYFRILICTFLVIALFTISSYAALQWDAVLQLQMSMDYNPDTEIASVFVSIYPFEQDNVYEINVALEQFTINGWEEVASWPTQTFAGQFFSFLGETTEKMPAGFTYRVHVTGNVDNGFCSDDLDQYGHEAVLQ